MQVLKTHTRIVTPWCGQHACILIARGVNQL